MSDSTQNLQPVEGLEISNIVKEYPDMLTVYIYHNSYRLPPPSSRLPVEIKKSKISYDNRSLRRSRSAVKDIIYSNQFDLWCTFTFDKRKVDRHDIVKCRSTMSIWLHRQRLHSPDLKYIIVPEYHKDGAIHFHALMANFNGKLKDSGIKKKGHKIYNATGYRSGFTEFVKLDQNAEALSNYMTKQYLTKDMPLFSGSKRYWTSQNLVRPISHVNGLSKYRLWSLVRGKKPHYINDNYEVHHIQRDKNIPLSMSDDTPLLPLELLEKIEPKQKARKPLVESAHPIFSYQQVRSQLSTGADKRIPIIR